MNSTSNKQNPKKRSLEDDNQPVSKYIAIDTDWLDEAFQMYNEFEKKEQEELLQLEEELIMIENNI